MGLRPLFIHACRTSPSSRISPHLCMCPPVLPVLPLFPCTALLYSLVPITPCCSVTNRRVARVASYWLANSVRPVLTCPIQLFPFRFGVRARPSGPGSDWRAQLVCRDLVGRIFWCSDRSVAGAVWDRGKGYMLLNNCTHTIYSGGFFQNSVTLCRSSSPVVEPESGCLSYLICHSNKATSRVAHLSCRFFFIIAVFLDKSILSSQENLAESISERVDFLILILNFALIHKTASWCFLFLYESSFHHFRNSCF